MKNKAIMAFGAFTLIIALATGISYAWFTDQAQANPTDVEAGYLDILLTDGTDDTDTFDNIFPAENGKEIEYTITNSSSKEVIVQFKAGALTAYVMPLSYLEDGYIIKEYHSVMQGLTNKQKMNVDEESVSDFEKIDNVPMKDVTAGIAGDWILTGDNSEYLGKDTNGNQYFLLSKDGTAQGSFEVALTAEAGNRYQYALLSLSEPTALATQYNPSAIAAAFNGLDIEDISK